MPRDTRLLVNLYAIHHDPQYWDDPLEFRPERFLQDGQFRPDKHLIPFGIGESSGSSCRTASTGPTNTSYRSESVSEVRIPIGRRLSSNSA